MEKLIQQLRDRRIAVTPQRLAVMAALQGRRDHPTGDHIYQEVRRQHPAISFNTVYKTLEILCQRGMVIKVNPLHAVARYDGTTGRHAHLICRQWGRLEEVVFFHHPSARHRITRCDALEGGDGDALRDWTAAPAVGHTVVRSHK